MTNICMLVTKSKVIDLNILLTSAKRDVLKTERRICMVTCNYN